MGQVRVVWARTDDRRVADLMLRDLAAGHLGRAVEDVSTGRICPRCGSPRHGRPFVRDTGSGVALGVSISRSSGVTLVAMSSYGAVGVDVEGVEHFSAPDVAGVLLHPCERESTAAGLATTWVRKEALLKASGDGLWVDPATLRLGPSGQSPVVLDWPQASARPDWLVDLDLAPGLRGAVAGTGRLGIGDLSVRQAAPEELRG